MTDNAAADSQPTPLLDTDPTRRAPVTASLGRRALLRAGALTGLAIGAVGTLGRSGMSPAQATETGPETGATRADTATRIRNQMAAFQRSFPLPEHPDNGDELLYSSRWASYSKVLPHDAAGVVTPSEYNKLLTALRTGNAADFEQITLGGTRALINPLAAYTFVPEGADSHAFAIPPAPMANSKRIQTEMADLYWMSLARDIPFDNYAVDGSGIINAAVIDLNSFRAAETPPVGPALTTQTVFRDVLPDNANGNYISQFLLQPIPFGAQMIPQTTRRRPAGDDHLQGWDEWARVQNGGAASSPGSSDLRYIRNGRDLAEYVRSDFPAQAALGAARIIAGQDASGDAKFSPAINDPNNPYARSSSSSGLKKQIGFVTFGNQMFFDLVTRAGQLALQAAWYQKWLVHRRLRPEEYGGRVEATLRRGQSFVVGDQLRTSLQDPNRLGRVPARQNGSFLLAQAFPDGAPAHPAYPSGHSTFVGAGVTMIKAFVDGTLPVANPVRIADPNNGDTLTPISANLTINQELDKLVMNIGVGRLHAGVHWRSDHYYGVRLGELVAIRALQDFARTYAEPFNGWELRRFDGTTVVVTKDAVTQSGTAVATTNVVGA